MREKDFWVRHRWKLLLWASLVFTGLGAAASIRYVLIGSLQLQEYCGAIQSINIMGRLASVKVDLSNGTSVKKFYVTPAVGGRTKILNSRGSAACALYDERIEGGGHTWFSWVGYKALSFHIEGQQIVSLQRMRRAIEHRADDAKFYLSAFVAQLLLAFVWLIAILIGSNRDDR